MDKIYNWQELDLQSLDIILCKGKGKLSRRIHKFQRYTGAPKEAAEVTHVAGIKALYPSESTLGLQVEESTTLNKWSGQTGVQRSWLSDWLPNYNGEVLVRKLDFERSPHFYKKDLVFWDAHKDDEYESGILGGLELLLCGLRLNRFIPYYKPLETKNPHCTEHQALRMDTHLMWNSAVCYGRMPPWIWLKEIDKSLAVPISEPIRIK